MKTKTKVAAAAAAALVAGAAFYVLPAAAHDRGGSFSGPRNMGAASSFSPELRMDHDDHVTVSAVVTSIPSSVTSSHQASRGAYFTVYALEDEATVLPSTEPSTGGRRVPVMPERSADGSFNDVLSGTTLNGVVGLHADEDGLAKFALYPSDGTTAVLVTVTTDSNGNSSADTSNSLSVAYSDAVAAEAPSMGMGPGHDKGDRRHGGREGHGPSFGKDHRGQQMNFTLEGNSPNA